ncbi:MAG: hypothetical protein AABW81_04135 [Nanoarchaeota archaeon]|mgnify:CR=1 FL=1
MAKKKRVKKAKKVVKKVSRTTRQTIGSNQKSFDIVVKNLVLYIVLSAISLILYRVVSNPIYESLFLLLSVILGFIALAFLIALLVLVFLRMLRN